MKLSRKQKVFGIIVPLKYLWFHEAALIRQKTNFGQSLYRINNQTQPPAFPKERQKDKGS